LKVVKILPWSEERIGSKETDQARFRKVRAKDWEMKVRSMAEPRRPGMGLRRVAVWWELRRVREYRARKSMKG